MAPVIAVAGLVKTFGSSGALDGLDLSVEAGEVHGFLGPNGAGKTTTIRVLLGLLRADAGAVRLLGGDPWRDSVELHRRLAYVPGDVNLWPRLTGGEVIDLFARLRGDVDERRRDELIRRFELNPTKRARTYSKVSPSGQTPAVPADPLRLLPLALLCAIAVGLVSVGLSAFRSRALMSA